MMHDHSASSQQMGNPHSIINNAPAGRVVPSANELSVRDLLYPIFRYKWMILLMFMMTTCASFLYVSRVPDSYASEARLMITDNRPDLVINPMADSGSYLKNAPRLNIDFMRAELGIIQSIVMAEKVVERVGAGKILGPAYEARAKQKQLDPRIARESARLSAVKALRRNLEAQPNMSGSNILLVSYKSYSPQSAQEILTALIDVYIQHNVDAHRVDVAPSFFDDKTRALEKRMKAQESELAAVRKQLNITTIQDGIKQLSEQLSALETSNKESVILSDSLRAKIKTYEMIVSATAKKNGATGSIASLGSGTLLDDLKRRLVDLQMQESILSDTYNSKAPVLQDIHKQIDYLKRQILEAQKKNSEQALSTLGAADPTQPNILVQLQMAKADLDGQLAAQKSRDAEIVKTRQELAKLLSIQSEVASLEREVLMSANEYELSRNSKQIADISKMMDEDRISNISVIQEPSLSPESSRNVRKLTALLVFGSLMGMGMGIAGAFGLEFLKSTVRRPEDIEYKMGVPVLLSLPRIEIESSRAKESVNTNENGISMGPCDGIKRQIELLKLRILTMARRRYGDKPLSIMFTGCHPGSGISTIASNFAIALSKEHESNVLMVDYNLKQPGFKRVVAVQKHGRKSESGETHDEVLVMGDRKIAKVHSNLDVIVNYARDDSQGPPFLMGEHNRFLQAAKMRYNYIVIDSPALSEASYSTLLATNVDVLVLVVEAEGVRRHALKHAIEQMEELDINLCGVVLNKRRYPIPGFIYKML